MKHLDSQVPEPPQANSSRDPIEDQPEHADLHAPEALANAIRSEPPPCLPATPPRVVVSSEPSPALAYSAHVLWSWVLPTTFFVSIITLALYAAPFLLSHWRLAEAHVEAE